MRFIFCHDLSFERFANMRRANDNDIFVFEYQYKSLLNNFICQFEMSFFVNNASIFYIFIIRVIEAFKLRAIVFNHDS